MFVGLKAKPRHSVLCTIGLSTQDARCWYCNTCTSAFLKDHRSSLLGVVQGHCCGLMKMLPWGSKHVPQDRRWWNAKVLESARESHIAVVSVALNVYPHRTGHGILRWCTCYRTVLVWYGTGFGLYSWLTV